MTPNDLAPLLAEFYVDRLAVLQRHAASAQAVGDYDVNNAYQYAIAREETHLLWVHRAILDVGGTAPGSMTPLATTVDEEGVLIEGLPGYPEYKARVKWRWLPFVW